MEVRRASRAESGLRRPRIPRLVDRKPHPQRRLYLALGVLPWTAWREDQMLSLLRGLKGPSIGFVRPNLRGGKGRRGRFGCGGWGGARWDSGKRGKRAKFR